MPTYEYKCIACKHIFEKYQQITSRPLKKCPKCKQRRLVRLIGAGSGVIFKGSGFYCNDYGKKPKKVEGDKKDGKEIKASKAPKKPTNKNKQNKNP
jgi:putative FmdB family regulatory protein